MIDDSKLEEIPKQAERELRALYDILVGCAPETNVVARTAAWPNSYQMTNGTPLLRFVTTSAAGTAESLEVTRDATAQPLSAGHRLGAINRTDGALLLVHDALDLLEKRAKK